jgi:hypothetical protein
VASLSPVALSTTVLTLVYESMVPRVALKLSSVLRLATKLIEKIDMNQQHSSSTQEENSLYTKLDGCAAHSTAVRSRTTRSALMRRSRNWVLLQLAAKTYEILNQRRPRTIDSF